MMGQRLTLSFYRWPLREDRKSVEFVHYFGDDLKIGSSLASPFEPLYYVAVCTDEGDRAEPLTKSSLFTEGKDTLYVRLEKVLERGDLIAQREQLLESFFDSWS